MCSFSLGALKISLYLLSPKRYTHVFYLILKKFATLLTLLIILFTVPNSIGDGLLSDAKKTSDVIV